MLFSCSLCPFLEVLLMHYFKVTICVLSGLFLAGCFSANIPFVSSDAANETASSQSRFEVETSATPLAEHGILGAAAEKD